MELTAKGRYAVMAMGDLARHSRGSRSVPLSQIAERQQISLAYLEQIFAQLRRAGLVTSTRGRSGGYQLGHRAHEISINTVMSAVDEGMTMVRCNGSEAGSGCVGDERCITHDLWTALGGKIASFLSKVTLQDLLDGKSAAEIGLAMAGQDTVGEAASGTVTESSLKIQIAEFITEEGTAE